jgi:hypothetical protein
VKIKLLLIILLTVISSSILYSQGRMSHEERMEILKEKLSLSDEQYTQIDTILKVQTKEFQKLRDEVDGDREQMREKSRGLRKETDDQITEVLNEDQIEEYEKYKEERRQNRQRR